MTRTSAALEVPSQARQAWHDLQHALAQADDDHVTIPCRSQNAEDWTSDDRTTRTHAAQACTPCPARRPCATYARRSRQTFGAWGGHDRTPHTAQTATRTPGVGGSRSLSDTERAGNAGEVTAVAPGMGAGRLRGRAMGGAL